MSVVCTFCFEEASAQVSTRLKCGHTYHTECMIQYIMYICNKSKKNYDLYERRMYFSVKCPLCRRSVGCKSIHEMIFPYYENLRNEYDKQVSLYYTFKRKLFVLKIAMYMKNVFRICINEKELMKKMILERNIYNVKRSLKVTKRTLDNVNMLYTSLCACACIRNF